MLLHFQADGCPMPPIDERHMQRWLRRVAASLGYDLGEVHYIFCSDDRELEVNRQFLGHDYYTDTITFSYSTEHVLSGDIFISVDTVRSNAEQIGTLFEEELLRVVVHSLIHLTGQNDKTPETKAEMTRKEDAALALY